MAQSLLSGFIYLAIASIVIASVFIKIVHSANDCVAGTLGANCNGSIGWGTYGQASWSSAEIALYSVLGLAGVIALLFAALQLGGVM